MTRLPHSIKPANSFFIITAIAVILVLSTNDCRADLPITGKGMYLWQLWNTGGGGQNLAGIISRCQSTGIGWLVIKMADGDSYYNSPGKLLNGWATTNYGSMENVIAQLHNNGIKLLAFQYVYGVPHHWGNPESETTVANMILDVPGIDGLLIDAEIQYDTLTNRDVVAAAYCDSLRASHPGAFIGLTAWARVVTHATFPWVAFLSRTDVNMPQTYWAARPTSPSSELNTMSSQFTTYTNIWISQGDTAANKPIMPIGQGEYFGYSNDVAVGEVASFSSLCQSTYDYPGISLWEYNQITHTYIWDEYAAAWPTTGVSFSDNIPTVFSLAQNYPNPFNPSTVIEYTVGGVRGQGLGVSRVRLAVYDMLGREVAVLVDEEKEPGTYLIDFNGSELPSGVYFYRITSKAFVQARKMILLK